MLITMTMMLKQKVKEEGTWLHSDWNRPIFFPPALQCFNEFVQIGICICTNCKMYFSKTQIVFYQISKDIWKRKRLDETLIGILQSFFLSNATLQGIDFCPHSKTLILFLILIFNYEWICDYIDSIDSIASILHGLESAELIFLHLFLR